VLGERVVEITYDKDRTNAGEVLAMVQGQGWASSMSRPARPIWKMSSSA
jgi:hypothetical protein